DNSISKTVNVSETLPRDEVRGIYTRAFDLGLKGCTVFRSNSVRGEILSESPRPQAAHCCVPSREGD
ncbi:MAG: ribonucleoside-diphosphate reductase, adenosylcobalamin-dependent, partial [Gammaproteobacteria bacterium]